MQRSRHAWWLAMLVSVVPAVAVAQGTSDAEREGVSDDRARAHFDVGRSLYDAGRFAEAAEEWEKSHALSNRAALLYNIYVAYRDASNRPKAIGALERYLASDVVPAEQRINLEARLEALREAERSEPVAESTAEPAATPGVEPTAELAVTPDTTAQTPTDAPSILPYVLVGVGGALVAGGVVTGIVASGKVSDIEEACPDDRCPPAFALDDERSDARVFVTMTDVLLVSGFVVAGAGAAMWLFGEDAETDDDAPRAAIGCAPRGCMATLSGRL